MSGIAVLGAGAFGTALAIALAREGAVTLWARDGAAGMQAARENARRLPGAAFPDGLAVTGEIAEVTAEVLLLAIPMQRIGDFLARHGAALAGRTVVACAKGVDLATGLGPTALIRAAVPTARAALLTGPSFAADIARGLPTALTLAMAQDATALQARLSTPALRLYRTTDVTGAELGGALKNVVAIAAGVVIGAGFGDSARAALMTRGYAEMTRLALALGARAETLAGLSGLGDLVLTCTSAQSRNFRFGQALGRAEPFDPGTTVEGAATAQAAVALAARHGIEMPVAAMVAALIDGRITIAAAAEQLLTRPLKEE